MKLSFTYICLICFCLLSSASYAQSARKFLKQADTHFQYKEYALAIPLYQEALKLEPDHSEKTDITFRIGYCFLQSSHRDKALEPLLEVYKANPKYDKELEYFLAQAYHFNHEFDNAIKYYEQYKSTLSKPGEIRPVDKKIKECEFGKEYLKTPVRARIENIGSVVNSKYPDYVPVISADESVLIFTSRREGSTGGEKAIDDGLYFEDVYVSYKKDGNWQKPQNLGKPINSNTHDACIALSPDGSLLFVYQPGKGGMGDIYVSKKNGDNWTNPSSMGDKINTKYREPSVSITPDDNTIYFSSDRPGGFGGLDIYMSKKNEKGEWGDPVNLGPGINTDQDEDGPFIHDEETLYFSSQGHSSMGGFDIFVVQKTPDGKWSTPLNLGYPINTADDDIYFVLSADNKRGYYASSKEGGSGEKDIYIIYMPEYKEIKLNNTSFQITKKIEIKKLDNPVNEKPNITILKGTITDKKTKQKLVSDITLVDLNQDAVLEELVSEEPIGKYETVMKSGNNYLITVSKAGYLFHSENFDIPQAKGYQEVILDVELERLEVGAKITLKVFYDFDKDFLRDESKTELKRLVKLLKEHPNLKVEISGHTDSVGTDEKNQDLSERRAKSVVQYLTNNGINASRVIPKGYGESKPISTNDTDEGRQLNRRTECKIIGI